MYGATHACGVLLVWLLIGTQPYLSAAKRCVWVVTGEEPTGRLMGLSVFAQNAELYR